MDSYSRLAQLPQKIINTATPKKWWINTIKNTYWAFLSRYSTEDFIIILKQTFGQNIQEIMKNENLDKQIEILPQNILQGMQTNQIGKVITHNVERTGKQNGKKGPKKIC